MSVALHEIKTEFENCDFISFPKLFDVIKMLTQKQTCRDRGRFFGRQEVGGWSVILVPLGCALLSFSAFYFNHQCLQ